MQPGNWRVGGVGLPFGPKPRLILAYLNAEALAYTAPQKSKSRTA